MSQILPFDESTSGGSGKVLSADAAASYLIDGMIPNSVVCPSTLDELSRAMTIAYKENISVTPWGGGTRIGVGNKLDRLDTVFDLSNMSKVVEYNPQDLTCTVQAGITINELQSLFRDQSQFLALDPSLPNQATIGGTLALGLSGPSKWQYGSVRDLVIGMKVVQADGKVTKSGGGVVKNVSGYDMSKLHVGGLGTLAIIAEISLKLTPLLPKEATVLAGYDTFDQCFSVGLDIFRSKLLPNALTTFDDFAKNRIVRVPYEGNFFLSISLAGRELFLERQINECRSICARTSHSSLNILYSDEKPEAIWRNISDFGLNDSAEPLALIRISTIPTNVNKFVGRLNGLDRNNVLDIGVVTHLAHGTILVGLFNKNEEGSPDSDISYVIQQMFKIANLFKANMILEKCPLEIKNHYDVWGNFDESVTIMRSLKEQYDPKRLLNPGRFVGNI